MKTKTRRSFLAAVGALAAFAIWTVAVCTLDIRAIGPEGTSVGFAVVNGFFHKLTGVHMVLYTVTDWLGLVPVCVAMGFGLLGLIQWIKRKNICRVDFSILVLGGYYIVVIAAYLFFEEVVINYRPVLINGLLEPSYPSSTTLLVLCVMPTAIMQMNERIRNKVLRRCIAAVISLFILFMVVGRLMAGVHWVTDIIGGILLSTGLVMMYHCVSLLRK